MEFPGGPVGEGLGVVTALAPVAAMAWVRPLAWELLHAANVAKTQTKLKIRGESG